MHVKLKALVISLILVLFMGTAYADTYNLNVDGADIQGPLNRFWEASVGSTHMGMINSSHYHEKDSTIPLNLREPYKIAANDLGFKRVRGHGILCDDIGIYNEDSNGNPYYVWDKYNELMDYIIYECNLRPIVELSYMPYALACRPNDKVFWYAGNISPPKDWNKWKNLIYEVVKHSVDRYGKAEVDQWHWEVWNEPNLGGFWSGTEQEYHMLYDYAVQGAVSADPDVKVGGPAVDGQWHGLYWIDNFLAHCATGTNYANGSTGTRLNFLSYHLYPDNLGEVGDARYYAQRHRTIYDKGAAYPQFDLEYLVTETGTSYVVFGGNYGYLQSHDSAQSASFAVQAIHLLMDNDPYPAPDVWSYWVISDVWEEGFQEPGDKLAYYGIMGMMLRKENIYKPVYHAFKMLHSMGDNRIKLTGGSTRSDFKGVNGFASISEDNSQIQVIVYNQDYYSGSTHPDETLSDIANITIENIPFPSGEAYVELFGVDKYKGNTYSIWSDQGQPEYPSEAQWDEIRNGQYIEYVKTPGIVDITNGSFSDSFDAYHCGVYLYVLTDPDSLPKPDLVVTDISWEPSNPVPGDEITFSATVKNQGDVGTPEGIHHGVAFSIDGEKQTWSAHHSTSIPPYAAAILTATGGVNGAAWTAVNGSHDVSAFIDDVYIIDETDENNNKYNKSMPVGTQVSLPEDWSNTDIGYVKAGGSASYNNGIFTIAGSGKDIWDKKDEFHFAYKQGYGDTTVIAKVTSQENTEVWAKAGVMIRESFTDNSKFANVVVTPSNGVAFQWRSSNVSYCSGSGMPGTVPVYVKLERKGNNFSAYSSDDGISWTQIGSTVSITMDNYQIAGLCVTSTNDGVLSTATFSDVNIDFQYTPGTGDGLFGQYFDNMDFSYLKMERVDADVNFNWGYSSPGQSIGSDTYSIRWTGFVTPHYTEEYMFYTTTDDGVRLWVDNQLVIDKWYNQGATEHSGEIDLSAYTAYPITIEYYENTGEASASMSWSSASQAKEIVPRNQLTSQKPDLVVTDISWTPLSPVTGDEITFSATIKNQGTVPTPSMLHAVAFKIDGQTVTWSVNYFSSLAPGESVTLTANDGVNGSTWKASAGTYNLIAHVDDQNIIFESNDNNNTSSLLFFCNESPYEGYGLYGAYYDNIDFTDLKMTRTDSTVNFNWQGNSPDSAIGVDTYSIRWTGSVTPLYSETYTFYTTTDDGVRLWINEELIIDKWIDQGATEHSGTIALNANTAYSVKLEYYENSGGASANLSWSSVSQAKEIIPQNRLYPNGYEAEEGTWGNGATEHGYYIGSLHNAGAWNQISNVDGLSGGTMTLTIRYATNVTNATKSLYVNGIDVAQIAFPSTGGWWTFNTTQTTITLNPGRANTIMLTNDSEDNEGVNIESYLIN